MLKLNIQNFRQNSVASVLLSTLWIAKLDRYIELKPSFRGKMLVFPPDKNDFIIIQYIPTNF